MLTTMFVTIYQNIAITILLTIPYALLFIPMAYTLYNWKFVPLIPFTYFAHTHKD